MIETARLLRPMTWILWFDQPHACDSRVVGGKAAAIAQLYQAGLPIPDGFVIPVAAMAMILAQGQLPDAMVAVLQAALTRLCPDGEPVAVRSSAVAEDGGQHSFAGQLDSFLDVPLVDVAAKVLAVGRSASSPRVTDYCRQQGLSGELSSPAVLVQRMVQATAAGVAFGADPLTGRRGVVVINAVRGVAADLVSGRVCADTYHVDRHHQLIHSQLQAEQSVLQADQVTAIARLTCQCGHQFSRPQDVEWALAGDRLYLLQSRPITTLLHLADPDAHLSLWDNSNIIESYNGITTPLTFAFARKAYTEVYQQFCRFMGVPEGAIAQHRHVFGCMIGFLRGRLYYNLLSWYRVLALLPAARANAKFLNLMMGVRQPLPEAVLATVQQEIQQQTRQHNRWLDWGRSLFTLIRIITNYVTLPQRIHRYYQRLDRVLTGRDQGYPESLADWRVDELVRHYRTVEQELLAHWDAPLINDFFGMIFYGVLRAWVTGWCGDATGNLQNDLISGEGGVISTEPAHRIREMAAIVAARPEWVQLFCYGTRAQITALLPEMTQLVPLHYAYLNRFGDRCLEELKLESATLHDDPLPLWRAIGHLAQQLACTSSSPPTSDWLPRQQAERQVQNSLAKHPLRRWLFHWLLRQTRDRIRHRENLRFERTRVFGRARRVFVELGKRFYALDLLDQPSDVFYLEVEEILGMAEGTVTCTDLRGLVQVRRAEIERYRTLAAPGDRIQTYGIPYQGNHLEPVAAPIPPDLTGDHRQGTGCAPGRVEGKVRVISHANQFLLEATPNADKPILVATSTDPGWILLFPRVAGLLVERGSVLSHVAIVARELGLPLIIGLPGITEWLQDGDWVVMDGSTGVVMRQQP